MLYTIYYYVHMANLPYITLVAARDDGSIGLLARAIKDETLLTSDISNPNNLFILLGVVLVQLLEMPSVILSSVLLRVLLVLILYIRTQGYMLQTSISINNVYCIIHHIIWIGKSKLNYAIHLLVYPHTRLYATNININK